MRQQLKGLAWLGLALAAAFVLAAGLPYLANLVPWRVEGRLAASMGAIPDVHVCAEPRQPEAAAALRRLVKRLYPLYPTDRSFPITVEVVSGPTVNAFATLGGHIYVYDGLLQQARSPEELAGILAHEIEHVRRRHILQGVLARLVTTEAFDFVFRKGNAGSKTAESLLNMRFSRDQEREADAGGLRRLKDARIDARGFERFFERLETMSSVPAILSDHPASGERARLAAHYLGYPTRPVLDQKDWALLRTICQ